MTWLACVAASEVLFSIDLRHPDNAIVDEMDCKTRHIVEAERGLAACKPALGHSENG
jgi:hypothetical protein